MSNNLFIGCVEERSASLVIDALRKAQHILRIVISTKGRNLEALCTKMGKDFSHAFEMTHIFHCIKKPPLPDGSGGFEVSATEIQVKDRNSCYELTLTWGRCA